MPFLRSTASKNRFKGIHRTLIFLIDADQNQKPVSDFKSSLFSVQLRPKKIQRLSWDADLPD